LLGNGLPGDFADEFTVMFVVDWAIVGGLGWLSFGWFWLRN